MNNKISLPYLILCIAPLFSAYHGPIAKENENNASVSFVSSRHSIGNENYVIDTKESIVAWKGSMLSNSLNNHEGYVSISKGELMIKKDKLVGGTVEVDMNTIVDKDYRSDNGLINHLKDPDFFDVKKFPIAAFTITKVASVDGSTINVTGNLTIKGITHSVTFPATVEVESGVVHANGKVTIDRTQWDVRYNSGKFYTSLADKAISDDIEFDMKIVAKK